MFELCGTDEPRIHESTECSLDAGTQRKALQGVDRQVEVLTDSFAVLTATLNRNRNIVSPLVLFCCSVLIT